MALAAPIHPDLRLDKLARLPPDLRRLAKLAAGGSLESLIRLQRPVQEGSEARSLLFLPVFYANLDLGQIPGPDEVDTADPSPSVVSTLMRAFVSIQALESYPNLPPDLYPIFWPRVWTWIDFLDTHHFCMGGTHTSLSGQSANRVHFLQEIWRFRAQETTTELVNSTSGVWTMVARLWARCVDGALFGSPMANVVCHFIASPISAAGFDEVVEALGGTQRDLATVVVQHFTTVTCDPRYPLTPGNLSDLRCVLVLMAEATRHGLLSRTEFAAKRLANALVKTSCALQGIPGVEAANLLRLTWNLLRWAVTENVLHEWIPAALKAGLLRAIVACATHSAAATDIPDFRQILTRDLPPSLVYRRVLRRLVKSIHEVKKDSLQASAIYDEWTAFLILAKERLAIFNASQPPVLLACDNMECGAIDERRRFRACSGCRGRCYCSPACQRSDWETGGHKATCKTLSAERFEELSNRDLHFLRTLLHHDYRAARREIWLQQLAFTRAHPGTGFYTRFDYSRGRATVHVLSIATAHHLPVQAAASGGRMEQHLMFVSAGSVARARWFPLRSSGAAAAEGLAAIARKIAAGADVERMREELLDDLRKLEEEVDAAIVQIH
ncbi:hypothetical protein C8R46DRAFT_1193101 [Mycena filopes]|nr:hypothetical protein C8R46DRAFT_1193101 [Mycena filopes]